MLYSYASEVHKINVQNNETTGYYIKQLTTIYLKLKHLQYTLIPNYILAITKQNSYKIEHECLIRVLEVSVCSSWALKSEGSSKRQRLSM